MPSVLKSKLSDPKKQKISDWHFIEPRRTQDFTYLMRMQSPISLHGSRGVIGAPFQMQDLIDMKTGGCGSFQPIIEGSCNLKEKEKANRMFLDVH